MYTLDLFFQQAWFSFNAFVVASYKHFAPAYKGDEIETTFCNTRKTKKQSLNKLPYVGVIKYSESVKCQSQRIADY